MGNCLGLIQQKAKQTVKMITTVDGEVLAYRPPPLKVREALSEFPVPITTEADQNNYEQGTSKTRVVRIRLVVSKQELKEMLIRKGGVLLSLGEMISDDQLQSRPGTVAAGGGDGDYCRCRTWKPALESIPETN